MWRPLNELLVSLQGYLAPNEHPPPRTLQQDYVEGPFVVLGGGVGSHERGTPVPTPSMTRVQRVQREQVGGGQC